jgi:hypothetical protein
MTFSSCGANLGGPTSTHAPSASSSSLVPWSRTVAVTGPSETSSYQPELVRPTIGFSEGEAELPNPPSTKRRPSSSVRSSPSGTVTASAPGNLIFPSSNASRWPDPESVRGRGSTMRSAGEPELSVVAKLTVAV